MLTGIIIGLLTALCIYLVYDKFKKVDKAELVKKSEEQIAREKEEEQHWENAMNFNVEKAYNGGKS